MDRGCIAAAATEEFGHNLALPNIIIKKMVKTVVADTPSALYEFLTNRNEAECNAFERLYAD